MFEGATLTCEVKTYFIICIGVIILILIKCSMKAFILRHFLLHKLCTIFCNIITKVPTFNFGQ